MYDVASIRLRTVRSVRIEQFLSSGLFLAWFFRLLSLVLIHRLLESGRAVKRLSSKPGVQNLGEDWDFDIPHHFMLLGVCT